MKIYEIKDHAPSLLPDEGEWELAWADEFDGKTLDESKWDFRLCMMQKRHPAWTDKGVHLDGKSNCVFTLIEEEGYPVSSQLQTGYNFMDQPLKKTTFGSDDLQWPIGKLHEDKFTHTYGYYECRCRLQQKEGWWSAFWMQSPTVGCSKDPAFAGNEVDIMECFHPGSIAAHNVFSGGYGEMMERRKVGGLEIAQDGYHTFGLLWEPTGYTFYVDGVADGHVDEMLSHRPEFLLISTEVNGWRKKHHAPPKESFDAIGDTFLVDHVRVFDRKK